LAKKDIIQELQELKDKYIQLVNKTDAQQDTINQLYVQVAELNSKKEKQLDLLAYQE